MASETKGREQTVLKVIDALDHPHGGRILRVRVTAGALPSVRDLKGATYRAVSPQGVQREVRVVDFPTFGGVPSDERVRRRGRVDLVVEEYGDGPQVATTWELHPA